MLFRSAAAEAQVRNSDMAGYELDQFKEKSKQQLQSDDYGFEDEKPKNNNSMTGEDSEVQRE